MEFLKEIVSFILKRKKFWLVPIIFVSLTLGGIVILTQGSAIAPFIYTVF